MRTEVLLGCLGIESLVILFLLFSSHRGRSANNTLETCYALSKIIAKFSESIAASNFDQLDAIVESGMRDVLELVGAGRLCWYLKQDGSSSLERIYSVLAAGSSPSPSTVSMEAIPYSLECLMKGEILTLQSLDDLPPEAERDREFYRQELIGRLILIPSNCGTSSKGVLGIVSAAQGANWPEGFMSQLTVFSNLIVTTFERKHAEQLRRDSERRFRCLFQEAPIGIALEDTDGRLLFVNPALCTMLGYGEEELLGMSCAQFSNVEDHNNELPRLEQLLNGSIEGYRMEKRFFRKDGTGIWGRVDISLLQDQSGDPPLVLAMLQDITGHKTAVGELRETKSRLEKLAHRLIQVQDDERSRISRELHDDIGQRLSLFGIELDLLGRSLTKLGYDRKGEQAALLHSQVNEIISDLHDLSHALHSTKLQHLGLRAALRDLCNRISQRHKVAMELCEEGGMRLPSEVSLCFYRVAQEALNNVLRHSEAEQVFVTLSVSNGIAQLSIKDTGIGFDTSTFSQGIGLLSMRERLRMMGGEFELESTPGKGTQVTARLQVPVEGAASQGR